MGPKKKVKGKTYTGYACEAPEEPLDPKYPKPKILLIDMPSACKDALLKARYAAVSGTFGTPHSVKASDTLFPVSLESCILPNYQEQEIVIANTAQPDPDTSDAPERPGEGVDSTWQQGTKGIIDPRPLAMMHIRDYFDRIQKHAGIFIVFVKARYGITYVKGLSRSYEEVSIEDTFLQSSWDFLSVLNNISSKAAYGAEIKFEREAGELGNLLKRGADSACYHCTLNPSRSVRDDWVPLACNKYGDVVGGMLGCGDPRRFVLILPQMPHVDTILVELLESWCAQWSPGLFPHLEGARWVHRKEYEVPKINTLRQEIAELNESTERGVGELKGHIEQLREDNKQWYTLLRGTGDDLVDAVIGALRRLGFKDVVDVDRDGREAGNDRQLREDIQIHDRSPVLVVDVKGIRGRPEDADIQQADKHARMRMREWDRTDVQPLSIINHQRHLPPRDRDKPVYRQEMVKNAEDTQHGLMTSWDLWRILRNKDKLGWPEEAVKSIFYRTGRVDPVPEHYAYVGDIVKVWKSAFGIIPNQAIPGDARLAVETGDTFMELTPKSLRIDDEAVETALAKSELGVGFEGDSEVFKAGMRVFLVSQNAG